MRENRGKTQGAALLTAGLSLFSIAANAAQWTTSAGIAPAVEYTDNVCLSADNEKGEWIGTVTPDVAISGKGSKANVSLAGSVEVNSLSDGDLEDQGCNTRGLGNREQYAPNVRANADAVLIDDWLFVDATANANQNQASPFVSGGDDSLNRTGNTNTTYRYSVSPYIARRFKDAAAVRLGYTYDDQYNTTDIVGDSTRQSADLTLSSGPAISPVSAAILGNYSSVDYADTPGRDTNDDNELKNARLRLGYQINRAWEINGTYGEEWNDYATTTDEDVDGDFWDAGLRWTPSERTTVEAGTGDRFFGNTPRLSVAYRHKRSSLKASYAKELTSDRDIRTLDDGLTGGSTGGNSTTLSNSPILDERFTLGYSFQGRRSGLTISGSHSDQTQQDNGRDSTFKRLNLGLQRSLARNLSLSGSFSWSEESSQEFDTDLVGDSETWRANLGVTRTFTQNVALSFNYQYTDRQSDNRIQSDSLFDEYTENSFTLTLRVDL